MKKISPFLVFIFACSFGINAQNISFENTEGYTLGNINGQNNWSTPIDNNGFITNQVITDEMSSDGNYALKLTTEPNIDPQFDPMVGAFYTFAVPISSQSAVFSADLYLSEQSQTSFRNYMALVDLEENRYRTYFDFFFNGDINVFVKGGPTGIQMVYTGKKWTAATWFNAKIETLGDSVKFHIDGELVYKGLLVSSGAID